MAQALPNQCPVCRKPSMQGSHPFCSPRCANIDLGRWLGEKYAVPTDEAPSEIHIPAHEDDQ